MIGLSRLYCDSRERSDTLRYGPAVLFSVTEFRKAPMRYFELEG